MYARAGPTYREHIQRQKRGRKLDTQYQNGDNARVARKDRAEDARAKVDDWAGQLIAALYREAEQIGLEVG